MTLDEAIRTEENIAEECQRVVDTGIVFDDVTIDMLYCDDTEVIEEHLANYQRRAEEHRQLAEWLQDYKRLKEQESCCDAISREAVLKKQYRIDDSATLSTRDVVNVEDIEDLLPVTPQPKTGHWIEERTYMECPNCHDIWHYEENQTERFKFCPTCGRRMVELQERSGEE